MSVILQPIVINEKKFKSAELIAQLDKVPLGRMYNASFKAVVRLHLWFTGRTHELFGEFTKDAQALILKAGGKEQVLDGASGFAVQSELLKAWGDVFKTWSDEFQKVRIEAASIPFGVLAVAHKRLIVPVVEQTGISEGRMMNDEFLEAVQDGVFSPQLSVLLNAASEHLYGDSLNLSARIWNIDRDARDAMNVVLMKGIANSDSAWNIAQELEQWLGANQDCPRWTSQRLYGKTKSQIAAGDTGGLVSAPCDGRGVSYNALRLVRTEIQKAHALATDRVLSAQPWVEAEKINLSAAHPERDICDDVCEGGTNGDGVYPVGTIELPLHPNCLDYKTAVLMPEKEFTGRLNGWLKGEQDWAELDAYEQTIGGDLNQSILPNAINLAVWLFSDKLKV